MTRLDQLLEQGLKCGCGGDVKYDGLSGEFGQLICSECGVVLFVPNDQPSAIAQWIVTTNPPIPGSIKPPKAVRMREFNYRAGWVLCYRKELAYDADYKLRADELTIPLVTAWLMEDVG